MRINSGSPMPNMDILFCQELRRGFDVSSRQQAYRSFCTIRLIRENNKIYVIYEGVSRNAGERLTWAGNWTKIFSFCAWFRKVTVGRLGHGMRYGIFLLSESLNT